MANLADLAIGVTANVDDLTSGMDDAASSVEDFESTTSRVGSFVEDNFAKIGAAATGMGAGLEGFARSQQDTNATIGRMSARTGEAEDSIRSMLDGMTDHTFATADAAAAMELLSQRGVENRDDFEKLLPIYDSYADATGQDMVKAMDDATRGLGAFGIPASESADHIDTLTFMSEQMGVEMDVMGRRLGRVSGEMDELGLGLDEGAAGIKVFTDRGMNSRDAMNEFRDAVKDSDGDMDQLLDNLGITAAEWQGYQTEVEGAAGMTAEYAKINNDTMTPMQKMSANLENLMTKYGGLADAAGMVAAPMAGVGSAMMGVSMVAPKLVTKIGTLVGAIGTKIAAITSWAAATVAQGARALGSMAVTSAQFIAHYTRMAVASLAQAARMAASWVIAMGPIGWVIAAIVGLVALIVANWDTVKEWTGKIWNWVGDKIEAVGTWINDTVRGMVDKVVGFFTDLKDRAVRLVTDLVLGYVRWVNDLRDRAVGIVSDLRDRVVGFFTGLKDRAVTTVENLVTSYIKFVLRLRQRAIDIVREIRDRAVEIFTGLKDRVVDTITSLMDRVRGIKDDILGFFSGAGTWLFDAGKNIIQGIINGIGAMVGKLGSKMSEVTSKVRNFLPLSPAKEGPLSGRGSPDIAGAKLVSMIGDGMGGQLGTLAKMADATASAALPSLTGPDVPSVGMPRVGRMGGASAGALRPIVLQMDSREMARVLVDPLSGEVQRRSWHTAGASPW